MSKKVVPFAAVHAAAILAIILVAQPVVAACTNHLMSIEDGHLMSPLEQPDRFDVPPGVNAYVARVLDALSGAHTDIDVCFYDAGGRQLDCDIGKSDGWLPGGAAYIEVYLYIGLDVDYEVRWYDRVCE